MTFLNRTSTLLTSTYFKIIARILKFKLHDFIFHPALGRAGQASDVSYTDQEYEDDSDDDDDNDILTHVPYLPGSGMKTSQSVSYSA